MAYHHAFLVPLLALRRAAVMMSRLVTLFFGGAIAANFLFLVGLTRFLPFIGITISLPFFARPISCAEFARWTCVAPMSRPKRLTSSGLTLLDGHFGVTKTYQFGLVALFGNDNKLFGRMIGRSLGFVVATNACPR